jgi:hypothetical protein
METLGFCAAGLAEIPERIDRSAIRHVPQLWESLVRLQICADNVFDDLVGCSSHPASADGPPRGLGGDGALLRRRS